MLGVAVAGLVRQKVESMGVEILEPGLFRINGKSIDLRRKKAQRIILELLMDNPQKSFDVIELFVAGWGTQTLPSTYSERVYFAIYELRRVGFKNFIHSSEGGYSWAKIPT